MRAVIQRVAAAQVTVHGEVVGQIGRGYLVLLGVTAADGEAEAALLARKIAGLRVFEDDGGKMNLALADVGGAVLAVSQFTLYADVRKGRRPELYRRGTPGTGRAAVPALLHTAGGPKACRCSRASFRPTCRSPW